MSSKKPHNECILCGHSKAKVEKQLLQKHEELNKLHEEMQSKGISNERLKELNNAISILEDQIEALKNKKRVQVALLNRPMHKTAVKRRANLEDHYNKLMEKASGTELSELKTEMKEALANLDMYIEYIKSKEGAACICESCVRKLAVPFGITSESTALATTAQPSTATLSAENVPWPRELRLFLDQYVIGQSMAKAYIAGAVALHYRRAADLVAGNRKKFNKANLLLIGPTGVGKTEILRTLRAALSEKLGQIPMTTKSATKITEAGYVGEDAESIIESLFHQALKSVNPKNEKLSDKIISDAVQLTQLGIAHIDEIDKISDDGSGAGGSVSRRGAQNALLTMMEGDIVTIKLPTGAPGQAIPVDIDTSTILFIGSGAFMGANSGSKSIYEIAKARQQKTGSETQVANVGFLSDIVNKISNDSLDNYVDGKVDDIEPEDAVAYGLGHEFVGRLTNIITLSRLSIHALARIVVEPKNAILPEYVNDMLKFYNINIILSQDAALKLEDGNTNPDTAKVLEAIAERANARKTGARAIQSVINGVTFLVTNFPEKLANKYVMLTDEGIRNPMKLKVFDEAKGDDYIYIGDLLEPTLAKIGEKEAKENGNSSEETVNTTEESEKSDTNDTE